MERDAYRAYGNPIVQTPAFGVRSSSDFDWETRYGAYRWDKESGLYCVRYRYLHPGLGRWVSRDPIEERGGQNLLDYCANTPPNQADPSGLIPTVTKCKGKCGAIIDDWFISEIISQIIGWGKHSRDLPSQRSASGYAFWAYATQKYKYLDDFKFTDPASGCATKDCAKTVTLCGACVRTAILGNIMYGFIGAWAGFSSPTLTVVANSWKPSVVYMYDSFAYIFGEELFEHFDPDQPVNAESFCKIWKAVAARNPFGLVHGTPDTGNPQDYTDFSECTACSEKTKETKHGGAIIPSLPSLN